MDTGFPEMMYNELKRGSILHTLAKTKIRKFYNSVSPFTFKNPDRKNLNYFVLSLKGRLNQFLFN